VNIGEAAAQSGVPPKTIRYYEEIGLVAPAPRTGNGYRAYGDKDVHVLRFVQRARSLGFSVSECRQLVDLYRNPHRASAEVKALTLHRIAELDRKMAELAGMRAALLRLAESCHGDDRPECPIIENLAQRGGLGAAVASPIPASGGS
jgi:MerR family transcriptional regulator, copper efflux regulator